MYEDKEYFDYFYIKCKKYNCFKFGNQDGFSKKKNVNIPTTTSIVEDNLDIFKGLGLIQNKCDLKLKPNVKPVAYPTRLSLYNELELEKSPTF